LKTLFVKGKRGRKFIELEVHTYIEKRVCRNSNYGENSLCNRHCGKERVWNRNVGT
jgi:hypothetical protein